jgi:hypothetical protein
LKVLMPFPIGGEGGDADVDGGGGAEVDGHDMVVHPTLSGCWDGVEERNGCGGDEVTVGVGLVVRDIQECPEKEVQEKVKSEQRDEGEQALDGGQRDESEQGDGDRDEDGRSMEVTEVEKKKRRTHRRNRKSKKSKLIEPHNTGVEKTNGYHLMIEI